MPWSIELRHPKLAYCMIDDDVAYMNVSSVYRILRKFNLINRRTFKGTTYQWDPHDGAERPDQFWRTDLISLKY
jgi:hypothetical protein